MRTCKSVSLGTGIVLGIALVSSASASGAIDVGICAHVSDPTIEVGGDYGLHNGIFAMSKSAGLQFVRVDFTWQYIERAKDEWTWKTYDEVVPAAEAEGLRVLPILDYNSAYDKDIMPYEDAKIDRWTNYVSQVLWRYPGHFDGVEVWNEENARQFWCNVEPNVQNYIKLLKATYQTVKAIDPTVKVVMGGLAGRCDSYFKTLCSDGKNWFDVVAFHPYSNKRAADYVDKSWINPNAPGANGLLDEFLKAMSDKGIGSRPVWITEIGWPSCDGYVSEAEQASSLKKFIEHAESKGVERIYIYEFRSAEKDASDKESWFGLTHKDLTVKPALETVANKLLGSAWANPYAGVVFLAGKDFADTSSFASVGHWSSLAAPEGASDYLVDLGAAYPLRTPKDSASHTFGGKSLALGRVGGRFGSLVHEGASSTVTVGDLRLNNGSIVVGGGSTADGRPTLSGTMKVNSPASAPFTIKAENAARFYRLGGTLTGYVDSAIRFAAEGAGASLDVICDFDGSGFHGKVIADGSNVTLHLTARAMSREGSLIQDGIILRNGAKLEMSAVEASLASSTRGITAENGAEIHVKADDSFTLSVPVYGEFAKTGSGELVLKNVTGTGMIVREEGLVVAADAVSATHAAGYSFAADTFEEGKVGSDVSGLDGWAGDGTIVAGDPSVGATPGYPVADAAHTKILFSEGVTRTYGRTFAQDNQTLDFLYRVEPTDEDILDEYDPSASEQFAITVDHEGYVAVRHADASGTMCWSRLAGLGKHRAGEWIRFSAVIDYTSVPGQAFVQIRENGSCCIAPKGRKSPTDPSTPGSWLRLPSAASSAKRLNRLVFHGEGCVDDLLYGGFNASAGPGFDFGPVTSTNGIPVSWFDGYGIPRDPNGDPDGDHKSNLVEWQDGTDPLSPKRGFVIVIY